MDSEYPLLFLVHLTIYILQDVHALSTATVYKTPIGDLPVDMEMIKEIRATGKFGMMEAEHSMEMHLPYLAKVFEGFNYMHYDNNHGPIHKPIEALDKMGMDIIETGDPDGV